MKSDYVRGLNSKPYVRIDQFIDSMEDFECDFKELETEDGVVLKILTIEGQKTFMREDQAEKIFETMELKLYEETFKEIEDKYMSEKVRADRLEEEIEQLKEKYEGVLVNG